MPRSSSLSSRALPLLCVLLLCRAVQAEESAPLREHFARAVSLYRQAKYEEAIREYKTAYALDPNPVLLLNIGVSYLKLKQPREALDHFQRYRKAVPSPAEDIALKLRGYEAQARELLAPPAPAGPAHEGPGEPVPAVRVAPPARTPGGRKPRPVWRIATGSVSMGLGLTLVALGATGLAVQGTCTSGYSDPRYVTACPRTYDSLIEGSVMLAAGGALAIGGALLVGWPGEERRARADTGGLRLALSF